MSNPKIIAVVGGTGSQGGGLVRAILDDPSNEFAARVLTRNPDSDAAKALAARGAEVVKADLDDEASIDKAFEGAYGVFVVTAFWEYNSPDREKAHARTAAEAAKRAGVTHAIWSTLPDTRLHIPVEDDRMPTLQGKYKVPHFDSKGESDQFFLDAGVPTTFLSTTFYFEAFLTMFKPVRGDDGKLAISFPMRDSKLPGVASEDIGRTALGIFRKGTELVGQTVNLSGENLTGDEYAERFTKALGEEVVYHAANLADVRAGGFPGADDIANMFQYYDEFSHVFAGVRDPEYIRTLNPALQDFATWLTDNRAQF
jgi:uncharacterized protein YbjT (DUF2867 family)